MQGVALVPISVGELADKITILWIKQKRLTDASKLQNVTTELNLLLEAAQKAGLDLTTPSVRSLEAINSELWDIEDGKRQCEREKRFDQHFVQLARSVYIKNDTRAALKREINLQAGSTIMEEKSHKPY